MNTIPATMQTPKRLPAQWNQRMEEKESFSACTDPPAMARRMVTILYTWELLVDQADLQYSRRRAKRESGSTSQAMCNQYGTVKKESL
jgi:hypothetical protein